MEHNFNPNKGDYKYILEEERRKENGEAPAEPAKPKKSIFFMIFTKKLNGAKVRILFNKKGCFVTLKQPL